MSINMRKREVSKRKHAEINSGNRELVGSEFGRVRVRTRTQARARLFGERGVRAGRRAVS